MKAVVFVFRPMIKEFLNVWTFNLCSATTCTYPFAKHRLTKSSWNVVYLWINQIWQSRLALQIHFSITSDRYFFTESKLQNSYCITGFWKSYCSWVSYGNPSHFSSTLFHSHPPSVRTQQWVYLKWGSPSRDSLSIILSLCLFTRGWTCCTVHFSTPFQC